MKELSIKEKAERYDEVVNKLKVFMARGVNPLITRDDVQDFFPELKESEDEKVRKTLIRFFEDWRKTRSHCWGVSIKKILAWLKKQGEQKPNNHVQWSDEEELHIKELESLVKKVWAIAERENDKDTIREMSDLSFFLKTLNPEKKGEQKPTNLAEGEDYGIDGLYNAIRILEKTLGKVDGYQSDDGILEHECAISAVKKLYEQKPAWSEEDEEIITNIGEYLNRYGNYIVAKNEEKAAKIYKSADWLKDLKSRVQPQPRQEWSEEDKRSIRDSIFYLKSAKKYFEKDDDILWDEKWFNLCIEFLEALYKKLQPQTTWKPSKEQIIALRWVLNNVPYNKYKEEISGLLDQIK